MIRKYCVIKAGSAVVTQKNGLLDLNIIQSLCLEIASLVKKGWHPVLISSGAASAGRGFLGEKNIKKEELLSLSASIGQSNLISFYTSLFRIHAPNMQVGQLLVSRMAISDFEIYKSFSSNLISMLHNNIIPIINENDVLNNKEIGFSDNDQVASIVASMIDADELILISEADGVYSKNPTIYKYATKFSFLESGESWNIDIDDSNVSNGGMTSKIDVFKSMDTIGCNCHLIGKNDLSSSAIIDLIENENKKKIGTSLYSKKSQKYDTYKKWLIFLARPKGVVIISEMGAQAMQGQNKNHRTNLYIIGVEKTLGHFEKGDIVSIRDENFNYLGIGRTQYSYSQLLSQKKERGAFMHDNKLVYLKKDFFICRDSEYILSTVNTQRSAGARLLSSKPNIKLTFDPKSKRNIDVISFDDKKSSDIRYFLKNVKKKISIGYDEMILFLSLFGIFSDKKS